MKIFTSSILVSLLLIIAAPAYSERLQAIQIFRCDFKDETTSENDVVDLAAAWLKAAKETKGGENMSLAVRFPIAVGVAGVADFTWVISVPTFAEWGQFTDAYDSSAVSKVDDQLFADFADCGQSTMWEGIMIE
jgi:hypothetical protein